MKEIELGGLNVRVTGGEDGNGGGDGPLVVLLHGFGATGDDLVPLSRVLGAPRAVRFAFPEAPMDLGPAYMGGRAWWFIDMAERERARARGEVRDLSKAMPKGMPEARAKLAAMLDEARTALHADPARTVLGGFSQGAMLACDVALRTPASQSPFAALVLLSGTFVASEEWLPLMGASRGLRVLQSHGKHDEMLPFSLAERLRDALRAAGAEVEWIPFHGGHEIPPPVLDRLRALVSSLPLSAADAVTIRDARDEDSEALIRLIGGVFDEYPGVVLDVNGEMPELLAIGTAMRSAGGHFWVATRGDRVVGCAGFTPSEAADGSKGIELRKLYVARDERRSGLAKRLVDKVEETARARGATFAALWTDTRFEAAHRFYERRGYVRGPATRELHDLSKSVEYFYRRDL